MFLLLFYSTADSVTGFLQIEHRDNNVFEHSVSTNFERFYAKLDVLPSTYYIHKSRFTVTIIFPYKCSVFGPNQACTLQPILSTLVAYITVIPHDENLWLMLETVDFEIKDYLWEDQFSPSLVFHQIALTVSIKLTAACFLPNHTNISKAEREGWIFSFMLQTRQWR